jgi:GTP cyclohydrolase I
MKPEDQFKNASKAVKDLLIAIGEEPTREGLLETPNRVAKFYGEFLNPAPFNFTTFSSEGYDEMIIQKNIPFFSLCEHHMVPFFGKATVAYIPNGKIVGLSKLTRCVEWYARKLQNQERITYQIVDRLEKELRPKGVAVIIEARHLCMEMRGVKTHDVYSVTSKLSGCFLNEMDTRAEFMELMK